jgi:hypothetical protein
MVVGRESTGKRMYRCALRFGLCIPFPELTVLTMGRALRENEQNRKSEMLKVNNFEANKEKQKFLTYETSN